MKPRLFSTITAIAVLLLLTVGFSTARADHDRGTGQVIVNGVALSARQVQALSQVYGPIPTGNFWYDPVSGLWGLAGGPSVAQIMPGLALGGPLRADASNGRTGVFINGREIHGQELLYLQRLFGVVYQGRYWLSPQMIGGYEGGPPAFDLRAAGGGGPTGPGYNRNTIGGGLMSDGGCSGYLHPGGATVMTGNC